MEQLKKIIKELNDILLEVEKLIIRIISIAGWILILMRLSK